MDEATLPGSTGTTERVRSRPVFLTTLCLFSFIYFGLLSILFLFAIVYSGSITGVLDQYGHKEIYSSMNIRIVFAAGFVLNIAGFTGSVLLWKLRKTGYYLVAGVCAVFAVFLAFRPDVAWISTSIYILLLGFFGIFFKQYH